MLKARVASVKLMRSYSRMLLKSEFGFPEWRIFVILAENKNIVGLRASTIKQLRDYRYLIDDKFREQLINKKLLKKVQIFSDERTY